MKEHCRTYHSATHGPIPLSATGKSLMQKLRNAVVAVLPTGSYDANRQAIAHARGELVLYISKLEGNQAMCTKSNDPMEIEEIEGYEQLKSYVLKVARTHGEEAVRRLFEKRGCARLSSLPIGAVSVFRADLDRLAATPSPADIALNRAIAAASAPHGSYYASLDRDRALFEAGREYQRKY